MFLLDVACIWKLQPSLSCLFNEGIPKHGLIFMVRRNLEWRPNIGHQNSVNKNDPPFIPISYMMVLFGLFHFVFPNKVQANQGTRQSSTAFPMLPPSAASDKGAPGWVLSVQGWMLFSAFSWMNTSSSHTMVWMSMKNTMGFLMPEHPVFTNSLAPWWSGKLWLRQLQAIIHDRPCSSEYGTLTQKILIENTNIFGYFCLFFFPANKIKFRGLRQKPSLQIKAIHFTLLSCKKHGCRRTSCATGLHNNCNLQFHESVNPKTCKGSVEVVQLLYGVAALSTSSSPPHESEKKVKGLKMCSS